MSLFLRSLAEFHRRVAGWAVVCSAFAVGYVGIHTDLSAEVALGPPPPEMDAVLVAAEPAALAGYVELTVYGLLPPLLVALCAIGIGARAVAGLEETGELELLIAGPIDRRRLILIRFAAFALSVTLVGLVVWAVVLAFVLVTHLPVDAADVAAACVGLVLVGLLFGAMSFTAGAFTGDRAAALMLSGGLVTVAYGVRVLADTVDESRATGWLSPFHYHLTGEGATSFWPGGYEALLVLLIGGLLGAAVYGFDRRDVGAETA